MSLIAVSREKPFVSNIVQEVKKSNVEPHVSDFVNSYEENYVTIKHNFDTYSTQKAIGRIDNVRNIVTVTKPFHDSELRTARSASQVGEQVGTLSVY